MGDRPPAIATIPPKGAGVDVDGFLDAKAQITADTTNPAPGITDALTLAHQAIDKQSSYSRNIRRLAPIALVMVPCGAVLSSRKVSPLRLLTVCLLSVTPR